MLGGYPTESFAILLVLRIIFLLLDPTPVQAQAFPSVYPSTSPSTSQPPSIDCSNVRAEINIFTDQSPQETNWVLSKITTSNSITILEGNPQQKESYYADEICLGDGEHNFTIYDSYGDGIGGDGHYIISLDGKVIAKGGAIYELSAINLCEPKFHFTSIYIHISIHEFIAKRSTILSSNGMCDIL